VKSVTRIHNSRDKQDLARPQRTIKIHAFARISLSRVHMLLILTSSADATATYLANRLSMSRVPFVRIDTDTCVDKVRIRYTVKEGPTLEVSGTTLRAADVTALWLRRPREIAILIDRDRAERAHVADEWADAVEGFLAHVAVDRWMNHPTHNMRASHKVEQLTRAAAMGLGVPKTLVTSSQDDLRAFWHEHDGRVITKPLSGGYLERPNGTVGSIYTNRVLRTHIETEPLVPCPTLVQEEIDKEYDVRVTIIDDRITAVALRRVIDGAQIIDIRRDNMENVEYVRCDIPVEVEIALRRVVRSYELRFAAIDFAVTPTGEWVFFEINPNGQWAWLDIAGATTLWLDFVHAFSS
jgi:glutathione synthase/RimK-type ligase-like ATP-grasp enzyme